jgi:hypothetical protein
MMSSVSSREEIPPAAQENTICHVREEEERVLEGVERVLDGFRQGRKNIVVSFI